MTYIEKTISDNFKNQKEIVAIYSGLAVFEKTLGDLSSLFEKNLELSDLLDRPGIRRQWDQWKQETRS